MGIDRALPKLRPEFMRAVKGKSSNHVILIRRATINWNRDFVNTPNPVSGRSDLVLPDRESYEPNRILETIRTYLTSTSVAYFGVFRTPLAQLPPSSGRRADGRWG
jgi:hypothetical protein